MINPTPETVVPSRLNYVKVFVRFTHFKMSPYAFSDHAEQSWQLVSDDPDMAETISAWVDETKSLIISAETRTDISHGNMAKVVSQTTTVIYTKAVDYRGREPRKTGTDESARLIHGPRPGPTDSSPGSVNPGDVVPAGPEVDLERVPISLQSGSEVGA
jgi:hypothetical protein